jgi:putative sterol carrier protein
MDTAMVDTLEEVLQKFKSLVNGNARARALIKSWNPDIVLQALDGTKAFSLTIRNEAVEKIEPGTSESSHQIGIRASEAMLISIFSGDVNPSTAFIDGELEVYGSDIDRLKLDALTLVIWGV